MESAMRASAFGSSLLILLAVSMDGTKAYDKVKRTDKAFDGNVTVTHQKQAASHLTWKAEDRESPFCKTNGLIGSTSSCNSYHLFAPKEGGNPNTQVSDVRYSITKVDESSGVYTFDLNYGPNQNDRVIALVVGCGTPANRSHAKLTRIVTTTFNTTLTYTCDPGCSNIGWDNTITCQENGTWSETSLDCRVDCGPPDNRRNAEPSHVAATTSNTTVTFTCAQGYRNYGTNDTIVCQENGQWSPTSLDCQGVIALVVGCGTPANRSHAKLTRVMTTTFNTTLTYTCDPGCSNIGWDNTITCQENGTWSETSLDCRVDCGPPDNQRNAEPNRVTATTSHTTVTFTCAQGYRNYGTNDTIVCQQNGQWSPTSLDCQAIENAITTKTLSAGPATLTCTNRFSRNSGRKVSASCQKDEVLTDCSSKIESNGRNNGVKIVVVKNTLTCLLDSTGIWSDIPRRMRAVARCCKLEGIRCEYLTDGPTGKTKGERIRSKCAKSFHVTGCSAFMVDGWLDGVKIVSEYCSAFVGYWSHTGVSTYSACCKAPGLSCKVHKGRSRIRNRLMTKRCPQGSVLTGCAGYEHQAQQRGSFIKDVRGTPTCHVEGKNRNTVVYYVCCRTRST